MCTEPLYALRVKTEYDEKFKRFGKRASISVVCAVRDVGKDISKIRYNPKYQDLLMISCGQCMQCRINKVKQRAVMSICESLEHEENSFITLTFGFPQTYHYYRTKEGLSSYLSKKKAHFHEWSLETELFQKFMKKLRFWYYNQQLSNHLISLGRSDLVYTSKKMADGSIMLVPKAHIRIPIFERPFLLKDFKPKKIRVLHCGEYGSKRQRPHHHAILFGFQFPDLEEIYENGCIYYTSKILEKLWPFGIHRIGKCEYNSCAYVSRYVTKKVNGINKEEYYNGRKPEYVTYSTKPVLGANYFIKNYQEIVNTQRIKVYADCKVYECSMPKSYDNILKNIDIQSYNLMKEKRVTDCKTDLDRLLKSNRSIYSKLDSNNKIVMRDLRQLSRSYEELGDVYIDEYLKKAKAFGLNTKFFEGEFKENAFNFLLRKTFKDHKKKSTNQQNLDNYYKFELARRRSINHCYNVNHSDDVVVQNLVMFMNMPNPYKCVVRGRILKDSESIDFDSAINEKGVCYDFK